MTTQDYLDAIHLELVENPLVASYAIVRQRLTSQSGHLRVRILLTNDDFVEASEFFRLTPNGVQVVDYRHQWMDGERVILRKRWDSTPHYPDLENAPHHCHEGGEENVVPGQPMSIRDVLIAIAREMRH